MFCKSCGSQIPDNITQCPVCHCAVTPINSNESTNQQYAYSQPQYGGYGYAPGFSPADMQYHDITSKGDTARTLAILGIILSFFFTPIAGWVLGGIALSYAKSAYSASGNPQYKSTISTAKWSIGVASALAIASIVIFILMLTVWSAALFGSTYSSYDSIPDLSNAAINILSQFKMLIG